jgi:hypothetical protein
MLVFDIPQLILSGRDHDVRSIDLELEAALMVDIALFNRQ